MNGWQTFFDGFATQYDEQCFTQNTDVEIEFLLEHLQVSPGGRILDMGCGTGRHAVALAQRGYHVTGVDVSPGMLDLGRARAKTAGVSVEWVQCDAASFRRDDAFDAAIGLCEGALCLVDEQDTGEHDERVLANIMASLRPGGRLILNVLNACRYFRSYTDQDVAAGQFDILRTTEASDVPGVSLPPGLRERAYTPSELRLLLRATGFHVEGVFGGTAGEWGLRAPKLDEMELMAFARKPA